MSCGAAELSGAERKSRKKERNYEEAFNFDYGVCACGRCDKLYRLRFDYV